VISLLGAQAGSFRWREGTIVSFAGREVAMLAGGMFVTGALFWYFWPGAMLTRYGYVEVFYPPTTGFLLVVTGLIFGLFALADYLVTEGFRSDFLRAMGECSLAIYILHIVVIGLLISPIGLSFPLPFFLGIYVLLLAGMILVAYLIRYIRGILKAPSFAIRILIGG
jgi:peptidoglycan/LPS O-acetylase OafA/YrhL